MESDQKIKYVGIILGLSFIFSLALFIVSYYNWYNHENSINTLDSNIKSLGTALNLNLNATTQLNQKMDYYSTQASMQMDTLRTEDNLNFFRFWLMMQDDKDRIFIESQTAKLNTSCLSSIDNINLNSDMFMMWMTVNIDNATESRNMRLSRSAVTCYYFDMDIDCTKLCEKMTGEIE